MGDDEQRIYEPPQQQDGQAVRPRANPEDEKECK